MHEKTPLLCIKSRDFRNFSKLRSKLDDKLRHLQLCTFWDFYRQTFVCCTVPLCMVGEYRYIG